MKVKINYCSYEELLELPGVGKSIASQILDLREARGSLIMEDLINIPHLRVSSTLFSSIDFTPFPDEGESTPRQKEELAHLQKLKRVDDLVQLHAMGRTTPKYTTLSSTGYTHPPSSQPSVKGGQFPWSDRVEGPYSRSPSPPDFREWSLDDYGELDSAFHVAATPRPPKGEQRSEFYNPSSQARKLTFQDTPTYNNQPYAPKVPSGPGYQTPQPDRAQERYSRRDQFERSQWEGPTRAYNTQSRPEYDLTPYVHAGTRAMPNPQGDDKHWGTSRDMPRFQYGPRPAPHEGYADTPYPRYRPRGEIDIRREGERWDNRDRPPVREDRGYEGPPQANYPPVPPGQARAEGGIPPNTPARPRADANDQGTQRARGNGNTKSFIVPKTMKYDGKSNWQAFYAKFSRYAEVNEWGPQDCMDHLCWALEGKASEYYALLVERNKNMAYTDLVRKLEKRFGFKELPETAQVQFNNARQNPEESLEDWADRVLTLATKAFRNLPEPHMYQQAILKLCQGAADKEAGSYASNVRPANMEDAMDKMRWYHYNHQAIYGRQSRRDIRLVQADMGPGLIPELGDSPRVFAAKNESGQGGAWQSEIKSLENRLDAHIATNDKKFDEIKRLLSKLAMPSTPSRQSTPSRSPSPGNKHGRCYSCNQEGHFARNCPHRRSDSPRPKSVTFADNKQPLNPNGSTHEA